MSDLKTPHIPIAKIDVDPGSNVRTHIDEEKLKRLTASIEAVGVVQPLDVRPKKNDRFDLVAGERRYLAAKQAGLKEVPVIFGKGNAHLSKVVENLQREDLDPIDAARSLQMLKGELNLTTNKQLAEHTGLDAGWIGDLLRLLDLPEGVQRYICSLLPGGIFPAVLLCPPPDNLAITSRPVSESIASGRGRFPSQFTKAAP